MGLYFNIGLGVEGQGRVSRSDFGPWVGVWFWGWFHDDGRGHISGLGSGFWTGVGIGLQDESRDWVSGQGHDRILGLGSGFRVGWDRVSACFEIEVGVKVKVRIRDMG